jgi:hypothetical protein
MTRYIVNLCITLAYGGSAAARDRRGGNSGDAAVAGATGGAWYATTPGLRCLLAPAALASHYTVTLSGTRASISHLNAVAIFLLCRMVLLVAGGRRYYVHPGKRIWTGILTDDLVGDCCIINGISRVRLLLFCLMTRRKLVIKLYYDG